MTQPLSINLGLSQTPDFPSAGANGPIWTDSLSIRNALNVVVAALDARTGALPVDQNLRSSTPPGQSTLLQNISQVYLPATENISAGQVVNFWNSSGTPSARKASAASAGTFAQAFAAADVSTGDYGQFVLLGMNPLISGLPLNTLLYLNAGTSGQFTATPPAASGNIVQVLGYSIGPSSIFFNPSLTWTTIP